MTLLWQPGTVADSLVNLFGAGGAFVIAAELHRIDPRGPVMRRIVFALTIVGALLLIRGVSWLSDWAILERLVGCLAGSTPLVSLLVAEGLMRRHAPRGVKLALSAGFMLVCVAFVLPFVPTDIASLVLLVVVLGGFVAVVLVLGLRDRSSLTAAENAAIRRLALTLVLLFPLILTDFRVLMPNIPIRLGALGVLLILYVGFGFGSGHLRMAERAYSLAVFCVIAVVFAFGVCATGPTFAPVLFVQAAVVGLSGLLFAALFSEALGARSERGRPAEPLFEATSASGYIAALRQHPLLRDARILEGGDLDHVRHPEFDALLATRPILRRSAAPWGGSESDNGVERAQSLLATYEATHLLRLTLTPLRLMVLAVPDFALDTRTEAEIAMARRIAEQVYMASPAA